MNPLKVKEKLHKFFVEDIGERDLSTGWLGEHTITVSVLAKKSGIVAGLPIFTTGYQLLDHNIIVETEKLDGDSIQAGETIARITGPAAAILSGERVLLNLVQRMSGIATATKKAIDTLNDRDIRICDTRKTTPGLRMFEKYAVRCGGGVNHRYGLYDAIMIKDNHIDTFGTIQNAVHKAKETIGPLVKIEVEARTEQEVIDAVAAKAEVIMFDNCDPDTIKSWQRHVPEQVVTEASGGIRIDNLSAYQGCGVNFISLGYLTHSVKSLDISINVVEESTYVFS